MGMSADPTNAEARGLCEALADLVAPADRVFATAKVILDCLIEAPNPAADPDAYRAHLKALAAVIIDVRPQVEAMQAAAARLLYRMDRGHYDRFDPAAN